MPCVFGFWGVYWSAFEGWGKYLNIRYCLARKHTFLQEEVSIGLSFASVRVNLHGNIWI